MPDPCTDIHNALSTYLDAELQGSELQEFERHLTLCEPCGDMLAAAEREHLSLRRHLATPPQAPDLLRQRIMNALEEEDETQRNQQRRHWLAWTLPNGAAVAAAAALMLFLWTDFQTAEVPAVNSSQVTKDAARQHINESPLVVIGDRSAITRSAARFMDAPVVAPRFSSTEIRLLGWKPGQLNGKQSANFVYEVPRRTGKHQVSVHAVARHDLHERSLSGQKRLEFDGAILWIDSAYGFNTVTYKGVHGVAYVFSSDMKLEELVHLVTNSDIINMLDQERD